MKKIIMMIYAVSITLALTATEVKNDLPEREKLSEQLLEKLRIKKQISTSFAEIKKIQAEIIAKTLGNAPKSKEVNTFKTKISAVSRKSLSWDGIKETFIKIYAEAYSIDELQKLNIFFSSSTGQAFISRTPGLQRQLIPVIQSHIKITSQKIRKMADSFMREQMLKGQTKMPVQLKK